MKKLIQLSFVILLLGVVACELESNSGSDDSANTGIANTPLEAPPASAPTSNGKTATAPPAEFMIDANSMVGLITPQSTEEDIIKKYGAENVQRREIGLGEGEMAPGTVVFPGTDNELIIEWKDEQSYQKIRRIRIDGEKANWITKEGIRIGTTLDELRSINGNEFKFYGFEWDYAGTTNEWDEGKVDENLTVVLTPNQPEAAFPDLLGDQLFPSDHPKAAAADLVVSSISVRWNDDL